MGCKGMRATFGCSASKGMRAHARNIAVASGASAHEVEPLAASLAARGAVTQDAARLVLRARYHEPINLAKGLCAGKPN